MKLNLQTLHLSMKIYNSIHVSLKSTRFGLLLALIVLTSCSTLPLPDVPVSHELGQVTTSEDKYGTFYTYSPLSVSEETGIIVLIHGTPAKGMSAEETANYYITNWLNFTEVHDFILIAPAFNQEDFSSSEGDHALGGYRGLFGRNIAADEWVLRLVKAHQNVFGLPGRPIYLYGHSAGGQFVGRFIVTHPEQVQQAVITSAATYPQPNPDIAWPFGMGNLSADIEWDENSINHVDVVPEKSKWLAATQVPLTVIVGLNDTAELPSYPGQKGNNRFGIGRNWVLDMERFATENGLESCIKIEIIPGKGHSMSELISYSQKVLISN